MCWWTIAAWVWIFGLWAPMAWGLLHDDRDGLMSFVVLWAVTGACIGLAAMVPDIIRC